MENGVERRAARRFSMMLPLRVRFSAGDEIAEKPGETRDVSFRGLYFLIEANLESGSSIEFVLTLPQQITLAGDVHIRCYARVLRVDSHNGRRGVAARIELTTREGRLGPQEKFDYRTPSSWGVRYDASDFFTMSRSHMWDQCAAEVAAARSIGADAEISGKVGIKKARAV